MGLNSFPIEKDLDYEIYPATQAGTLLEPLGMPKYVVGSLWWG
jgi:hypothetical protein